MIHRCFVMIPFQEKAASLLWKAIEASQASMDSGYQVEFFRADTAISRLAVTENIEHAITSCDFALAEVSDYNPNVFFELGYATALRKPVVLLVRVDSQPPAALQGRHWLQYDPQNLEDLPPRLSAFVAAAVDALLARSLKTGAPSVASTHLTLDSADPARLFRVATDSIDILAPSLEHIVTTGIARDLTEALHRSSRLSVRIVSLDPESIVANLSAKRSGLPVAVHRDRLRRALSRAGEHGAFGPERCRFRLTDELIPYYYHRIDNVVLLSPLTEAIGSRVGMTLQLRVDDPGVGGLENDFERLWGGANAIDIMRGY